MTARMRTKRSLTSRARAALRLTLIFVWEFLKSNFAIARECLRLSPITRQFQPAILDYPLTVTQPRSIALLAQLITLTPGTLSLEVDGEQKFLRIHAYFGSDPDGVVEDIRRAFELPIGEVFE